MSDSNPRVRLAAAFLLLVLPLFAVHAQPGAGPSYGKINPEQMARMMNPVEDGPFHMINLIQFRDQARYPDGRKTDLTGEQANRLYSPVGILQEIGAAVVFVARVDDVPMGDGTEWDQVAIVRYPSRRAFLQMTQRPDFRAQSIHKDAGVGKTIVMVAHLIEPATLDASTPPQPSGSTAADQAPTELVHVLRYREDASYGDGAGAPAISGREAMQKYIGGTEPVADDGTFRFEIEGVFVGDDRTWDEVRIRRFEDEAALDEYLRHAGREQAERHWNAALADGYAIQAKPMINRLFEKD